MDDKKFSIQPNMSGGLTITCPFCSTRSDINSDELESENLICPNCRASLPVKSLIWLHSDGTPIDDEDFIADTEDFKEFGTSIPDILSHRGEEDDLNLANSIGFQLMEKIEKSGMETLSDEERYFYAAYELDNEVNNGGYLQYFDNSSGDLAYLVIDALQSICSSKVLKITKEALDIYGKTPSKKQEERAKEIIRITNNYEDNIWDKCDSHFYEIEDENIGALLMDYVDSNKDKIEL